MPSGVLVPSRCLVRPAWRVSPCTEARRRSAARSASASTGRGPAMPIRTGCSMPRSRSRADPAENRLGVEAELRDDVTREPGLRGGFDLGRERAVERLRRNARMAFRIAGDGDSGCRGVAGARSRSLERAAERPCRPVAVAGDDQDAPHAGQRGSRDSTSSSAARLSMSRAARCGTGSKPAAPARGAAARSVSPCGRPATAVR